MRRLVTLLLIGTALRSSLADDAANEPGLPRPFPGAPTIAGEPYRFQDPLWQTDDARGIVHRARDFADRNPDAPETPRVLLDWMMAARLARLTKLEEEAQSRLLFEHPGSFQAAYVMSRFTEASDLRKILEAAFDEHVDRPSPQFDRQYARALEAGFERYKLGLFGGDTFALKCWLAAGAAGEEALAEAARNALKGRTPAQQRINALVLDQSADPVARLEGLLAVPGKQHMTAIVRYLLARLPNDVREQPAVRRVEADCLIERGLWAEAVQRFSALPADIVDARTLYAQGCAEFAAGDATAAQTSFRRITTEYGETPWAASARELPGPLETWEDNLAGQASVVAAALAHLITPATDRWQATCVAHLKSSSLRAVIDADLSANVLELTVLRDAERLFAYRSDGVTRTYFFPGDAAANRYPETGHMAPSLDVQMDDGSGESNFKVELVNVAKLRDAGWTRRGLLSNESLLAAGGLAKLLRSGFDATSIPAAPEVTEAGTRLVWLVPNPSSSDLARVELQFDATGWFRGLRNDDWELRDLRYGTGDPLPPLPSPFDGLFVRDQAKVDPGAAMRAFTTLFELVPDNDD